MGRAASRLAPGHVVSGTKSEAVLLGEPAGILDRHFPEGWCEPGLGAQIVFNPSATKPGLASRLWEIEQPAAAAANQYIGDVDAGSLRAMNELAGEGITFQSCRDHRT